MIKRKSLKSIEELIKQNPDWKVLDLGCADRANKFSTHVADINDHSDIYKNKKFFLIEKNKKLPFQDNEFDFLICSHVLEHVDDVISFSNEIKRVSKKGYIELPTRLEDNLVFINLKAHKWWFMFNDDNMTLTFGKKKQSLKPLMSVNLAWQFRDVFRESMVIELYWEDNFKVIYDENIFKNNKSLSRFTILKKFLSYSLRKILRK